MNAVILINGLWLVTLACSLVIAGRHLSHRKVEGIGSGALGVAGALLTWGYVSACTGVMEQAFYLFTPSCLIAIGMGMAGSVCFFKSCFQLTKYVEMEEPVSNKPKCTRCNPCLADLAHSLRPPQPKVLRRKIVRV